MKPIKFSKKLRLNKETIADLNSTEMNAANGGAAEKCTVAEWCPETDSCPNTVTVCQTDCPSGTMIGRQCCNLC